MPASTYHNIVRAPLLVLGAVEALVAFSSVYVAAIATYGNVATYEQVAGSLPVRAALVTIVILTSLIAMGLYQFHQRIYYREAAVRVLVGVAAGWAVLAMIFYIWPTVTVWRSVALVAAGYTVLLLLLVRLYFLHTVDENAFRRRTLIYGTGKRAQSIRELRRRADRRGFRVVGRITAPGDAPSEDTDALEANGSSVFELAEELGAEEIVVAMDDLRGNLPVRELLECRLHGFEVVDLLEFLERETGKIRVDLVKPSWLIFSAGFRSSRLGSFNKRLVDVVVSTTLLLVTWPIMLAIALAIRIEDGPRAPVLYRQHRVGRNDRVFDVLKFRSMCVDAESAGPRWATEDDDRITTVGGFLRKFRLDELPQVINVLRGQMSLVGPRPERPEFVESLKTTIPYYSERHTVKPGVTGWAQLKYSYGSTDSDALEKLHYDLYYIKNQSLLLDVTIILQTVEVVLWGKGAR